MQKKPFGWINPSLISTCEIWKDSLPETEATLVLWSTLAIVPQGSGTKWNNSWVISKGLESTSLPTTPEQRTSIALLFSLLLMHGFQGSERTVGCWRSHLQKMTNHLLDQWILKWSISLILSFYFHFSSLRGSTSSSLPVSAYRLSFHSTQCRSPIIQITLFIHSTRDFGLISKLSLL